MESVLEFAHMTYSQVLKKNVTWAVWGLFIGCAVASLAFDVFVLHGSPRDLSGILVRSLFFFWFSFWIAAPVTLLYGWPLYAFFLHRGWNNLVSAAAIPLLPAGIIYSYAHTLGMVVMLYGGCISLATHAGFRLCSNNSFKPNPLRGPA